MTKFVERCKRGVKVDKYAKVRASAASKVPEKRENLQER